VTTYADLGDVDDNFQILAGSVGPSHAHVHVTAIDVPVSVLALEIAPGDLIHADRHGAAIISAAHIEGLPSAIHQVHHAESPIIQAARGDAFDLGALLRLYGEDSA
jgi:regulator of RNase E activity RraA